ncbi:MAG: hypothetical protein IPH31_07250 [Lewinellaceae bacterium]|nr:hypothetical protein [Lewinellaceae bacterium]
MVSVPYALKAGNAETERQVLTLEGNQLTISQGNTVTLPLVECEVEIADCVNGGSDTKVRVGDPVNDDRVHMDLGINPDGVARTDALVLRKNANGNTMLELNDKPGDLNTFIGESSGNANTATSNTGIGARAMEDNVTGVANTAVGVQALANNISGSSNIAIGTNTQNGNLGGSSNTAVGAYSMHYNSTESNNTATGAYAMYFIQGGANTATGYGLDGQQYPSNNTGNYNTAMGPQSLHKNSSGDDNTALGHQSLVSTVPG